MRAVASIDLAAIERNCARLRAIAGRDTALCAAVKANGYGHGIVESARAAVAGGATWLGVATADEAAQLRAAGVRERVIVLGALSASELPVALAAGADVVAWSEAFVEQLEAHGRTGVRVHLKLDVGMGRLGTRDADALLALGERIVATPGLELAGAMTHFPCADEDLGATRRQLAVFTAFGERLRAIAPGAILHAANSAATLALPESRLDMVRCGIAVYGLDPWGRDAAAHGLEPALSLRSYVAALRPLAPGQSVGYGSRFTATEPTWIATLPIGYGDGVRRAFSGNAEVVIGGERRPLVGRVSMDNVTIDAGPDPHVRQGDLAWLIGGEAAVRVTAEELAARIDTINYEITTALTARVAREYVRSPAPDTVAAGAARTSAAPARGGGA
jgi:alanine racemase